MLRQLKLYYSLLAKYLRAQRAKVVLLAALLLTGIGLQIVNPLIVRYFIDAVSAGTTSRSLVIAAGLFIGVAVASQALAVVARYVGELVAWAATNAMRNDLAMHCLRLDMSFHHGHTPGELVQRVDGDVDPLAKFFSQFVILVLGNMMLILGVLIVLFFIEWRVGLTFTLVGVATLAVLVQVQKRAAAGWAEDFQANANLYGFLEERISGAEDVRSAGSISYAMRRFYEHMRHVFRKYRRASIFGNLTWSLADLSWGLSVALALGLGAYLVTQGSITIGTTYLIVHYFTLLSFPLQQISTEMQNLQQVSGSLQRIGDILRTQRMIEDGPLASLPSGPLSVEFQGVSFAYAEEHPVLSEVSFRLRPGGVLGLVGRTGAGKTTLARLIFRLYDPTAGTIRLGGTDLREIEGTYLRQRVAMVTQDVQLFQATARDNLTLFDGSISDDDILQAIDELGLLEWYSSLSDGLDSILSPDGGGLSAGEAQLLAFTRVFLRDPSVVILDEATSRLDLSTERLVDQAVATLLEDRTCIMIAHRLTTLQRADEVMIIDRGRVREHDSRERLEADDSSYFSRLSRAGLKEIPQ